MRMRRHTPARTPYVPHVMAARSWVPGLSAVVCTENGGPLSPDQFSNRQVTPIASRALLGQAKPLLFDVAVMVSVSPLVSTWRSAGDRVWFDRVCQWLFSVGSFGLARIGLL